jgi:predicted secreted hydrolase
MRKLLLGAGLLLVMGLFWSALSWSAMPAAEQGTLNLADALSDDSGQFATVQPGRSFSFPTDHGEHPEHKTEWWYFTGNLKDAQGQEYGFQLTFFRAGLPLTENVAATGPWSPREVFMAHLALSEVATKRFSSFERFSRRSHGLSGVETRQDTLSIWLEDWKAERTPDGRWRLTASERGEDEREVALRLQLDELKPPVLQGEQGYSRKGPLPEHSSYYVSLTRLSASGTLQLDDQSVAVGGFAWFDHEWSSSALAPGLVGWDWFSLQLDDGWELMLYLLRYQDGKLEPASSGVLVDPTGQTSPLTLSDFEVQVNAYHTSPRGVPYPAAWTIEVPSRQLTLKLHPTLPDQEMSSGVPYWEGAVRAQGRREGQPIHASGFVELTGYE